MLELLAGCPREATGEDVSRAQAVRDVDALLPPLELGPLALATELGDPKLGESVVILVVVQVDLQGIIYPTGKLTPRASPLQ